MYHLVLWNLMWNKIHWWSELMEVNLCGQISKVGFDSTKQGQERLLGVWVACLQFYSKLKWLLSKRDCNWLIFGIAIETMLKLDLF